nr:protein slit-like [Onthophagus taurus]
MGRIKLYHILLLTFLSPIKAQRCKLTSREINCSGNDLNKIPMFQNTGNIEILDFCDNEIEELYKANFYNFTNLKQLRLNFNNIVYVEDNTFENLIQLESLDLSKNILEEVPDELISTNKKIITLNLSNNLFSSRTPSLYSSSLENLDLSWTKISYFTEENIVGLPNLKTLSLNANNLIHVNPEIFKLPKSFSSVNLNFNSWACNCETIKMFKKLTEENLFKVDNDINCYRENRIEAIYGKNGPISKRLNCEKHNNDSLINGIKSLEEILKMEKIYYQELRKEKDVLVSVTSLTMKILIVVIFFVGISLGILISTIMDKRIRQIRRRGIYRSDSLS